MIISINERVPIYKTIQGGLEIVEFTADADVDCDGSGGNPHADPDFQPDTRLHYNGKPLRAEKVPYVVVPPQVLTKTAGIVLGCLCELTLLDTGITIATVVGDQGPTRKIGEISPASCERLGLNPNPNNGGIDYFGLRYRIRVGVPAVIDGVTYDLQPA